MTVATDKLLEQQLAAIAAREDEIKAFVPGTFDENRIQRDYAAACERKPSGPLLGHLLGVKDLFHVDGYPTQAGTTIDPTVFAGPQASTVTALIAAGGVVAGKTTTAELACWKPPATANPNHLRHTPGGSSSGSAAGVGAGFFTIGFGTQTVGSVIRPAAYCGAVGFKPTRDRIRSDGIVDYSPSIDHVGFITVDLATLLLVLPLVVTDWKAAGPRPPNRMAVPVGPYLDRIEDGAVAFADARAQCEAAGIEVVEVPMFPDLLELEAMLDRFTYAEVAEVHADRWSHIVEHCDPAYVRDVDAARSMSAGERTEAMGRAARLAADIDLALDQADADCWLTPAAPGVATESLATTGDPAMNAVWTLAGLPVVTVPSGRGAHDLPLGIQLIGRWAQDEALVSIAGAFPS